MIYLNYEGSHAVSRTVDSCMAIEIGVITKGKVTGIAKFGAFVALEEGSGLVHISEVAQGFVNDVNDHLKVGDEVTVKVVSIDEKGRVNLSIRQALPQAPRPRSESSPRPNPRTDFAPPEAKAPASFEDMLQKFKQDSDSKLSDLKVKEDGRGRKRNRK